MRHVAVSQTLRSSRRVPAYMAGPIGCVVILACFSAPNVVRAEDKNLPDAATILDKYVEVTGGKDAYARVHNRVLKERVVHVDMDFEDSAVVYEAEPNRRYVEIESEAFGMIRNGTDGNIVWYLADNTGPIVQEGEARAAGLRAAAFNLATQWRDLYQKAECVSEELVDGKPCYKIVMTPNEGRPETCYFDKESNLLVKVEKSLLFADMPAMPLEFTFSDYKSVDGILLPHKYRRVMQQCGGKREMLFVTESIEHNVDMPANRFDPPKEILALAKTTPVAQPSGGGGCCGSGGGGSSASAAGGGCGGGSNATVSSGGSSSGGASGCSGGGSGGCAGCSGAASGGRGGCGGGGAPAATETPSADAKAGCCGSSHAAAANETDAKTQSKQGGCGGR